MNEKPDSKWLSLATVSILGQPPRKISWTWSLWEIWAKKTNNHSQIMAIVLIKSDSAGFFVQISSQNHGAISPTKWVSANKPDYI